MLPFGLNQMTVPHASLDDVLEIAQKTGCVGVEFRNDLGRAICDGLAPEAVEKKVKSTGLRILALAEVKAFNDPDVDPIPQATALVDFAQSCGAEGVALIPRVATAPVSRTQQRQMLLNALTKLGPVFAGTGVVGLIEPLGFGVSTLRYKDDVAEVLHQLGMPSYFRIVHDTFHHHLVEDDTMHADLTGLVHISGVDDRQVEAFEMQDEHRVLVGQDDRLGNVSQLRRLQKDGYRGPASFEAFADKVHTIAQPALALTSSMEVIADQMLGVPA